MAIKLAGIVRSYMLQAIEDYLSNPGTNLYIRTGAAGTIGDVGSGTILATIALSAGWWEEDTAGVYVMAGTWEDTSADASGEAGHFEMFRPGTGVTLMTGTVTATGGGGDMELTDVNIVAGQKVAVTKFTMTAGNG